MGALSYPVNLVLTGRRVVCVDLGGSVGFRVRELVECGALVTIIDASLTADAAAELAALEGVVCHARAYEPGDLAGAHLVLCGRDDRSTAERVAADAEAAGIWCNVADVPELCSFTFPARVRQGSLLVTFSTAGESPAVSSWLRRRYQTEFGPEYMTLIEMLSDHRTALLADGRSTEGLDWQGALDSGMLDLIREGRLAEAKERLQACLSSSSD